MKKTLKLTQKTVFVISTIFVIFFYFFASDISRRVELLIQDTFFKIRGPIKSGNEVVIAAIDEKSIDMLGRWPWSRNVMAELVDSLTEYKPKVIGFDIVFSSAEESSGTKQLTELNKQMEDIGVSSEPVQNIIKEALANSDNDQIFHDALKRSRKAVLGYFFHFSKKGIEHLSEAEMEGYLNTIAKSRYSGIKKEPGVSLKNIRLKRSYAVESTIEKISKVTKRAGYFNFDPDIDGSVRKIPLIVQYRDMVELEGEDDYLFPPLSLTVLRKYLKSAILIWMGPVGVQKVALMGKKTYKIPTNNLGEMRINYYGPRGVFPHYSIVDIIHKKIPQENLKNKIVLVGPTATAIEDLRIMPFDKVFPGVEVHATVIDNVLHNQFLSDPPISPAIIDFLSIITVGLILLVAIPRLRAISGSGIAIALAGSSLVSHYYLFSHYRIVVNTVPILLETGVTYVSLTIYRFIMEEKEKKYIQNAFGQYLSPDVITALIKDPSKLQLGGIRQELTAFFSDIAGFSTISEKLNPEELVQLLNEYLSAMSEIILNYNGTLDKYEGDAIIAFFGAPISYPDHAIKCCLAALEMQNELAKMRQEWVKKGKPELTVRIGINTGPIVVGNMGSKTRMDYTIMGDAVNLASRLEGANKEYGTDIMTTSATYNYCKDIVEVRELDSLRVVGKQEVVVVYELLSKKGELKPEKKAILDLYNEGLSYYKAWEWRKAIDVFSKILDLDINEGPSLTYLERSLDFQQRPPNKNWDGVYVMKTK